jgi:hypothetical protein
MKAVVTSFIIYPKKNQNGAGQSNSQTHDIDDREQFVFNNISPGNFEIVVKHDIILNFFSYSNYGRSY